MSDGLPFLDFTGDVVTAAAGIYASVLFTQGSTHGRKPVFITGCRAARLECLGEPTNAGELGSCGLTGAADTGAATALVVPRAVLAVALTARRVGSSLTDTQRCQRTPDNCCSHQPKRPTAREGAASQSYSQLVEGTLSRFCGHRLPPPRMTGLVSPAELRNVA